MFGKGSSRRRGQGTGIAVAVVSLAGIFAGCSFAKNDKLNQAALAGDRVRCEALLSKGANVNGTGMHGMKPIMSGAKGASIETVRYLVCNGADVNAHNDSGSALMWAIDSGNEELVRFLLDNGAEVSWTNALGQSAFDLASERKNTKLMVILKSGSKSSEAEAARPRSLRSPK